jgi:tetratricopeptide (TPR) repeat protein
LEAGEADPATICPTLADLRGVRSLACLLPFLAFGCARVHPHRPEAGRAREAAAPRPDSPAGTDRLVRWQRRLDDALAIAAAERRPIFLAINADGESASERIVRERYHDPAFVALTRPFVCLVASPNRHSPRDHESDGTRIQCPRFGEVTCGEHIALEPVVFDRYLGGERISPRHALVLPTGEKVFDLALIWDLREVDRSLAEAAAKAPPPGPEDPSPSGVRDLPGDPGERRKEWLSLAVGRSHRDRLRFETTLGRFLAEGNPEEPLAALEQAGDKGSIDAIRILLPRLTEGDPRFFGRLTDVTLSLDLGSEAAATLWDLLGNPGGWVPRKHFNQLEADPWLLRALARFDGRSARTRSFLLSYLVTGPRGSPSTAEPALRECFGEEDVRRLVAALEAEGGRVDPRFVLLTPEPTGDRPTPAPLPGEETLERDLAEAEEASRARPGDVSVPARIGRASLSLARRRLDRGAKADLLLADAERFLAAASESNPRDVSLLLDRARAAFHLGKFEDEERFAAAALALLPPLGPPPAPEGQEPASVERFVAGLGDPPERIDGLRWLGDATARLLGARSGGDPEVEVRGMARGLRAFAYAAAAGGSNATDWLSLASWFGAVGRRTEEALFAREAVLRFPSSTELHDALGRAYRDSGRVLMAVNGAASAAGNPPRSAEGAWYLGLARFLHAEWCRRGESPDRAIQSYLHAEGAFRTSVEMRPEFADSVNHYLAMAALGRGFAHLIADRRREAADCLVEGLAIRPAVEGVRDGLDREAVDLLDGSLEWRESGPSPVDPIELAERLGKAAPADARWIRKVADTELREALRCDGRGDPAEGDRHLGLSVEIARRALAREDSQESRRTLAQSATIRAERLLRRGESAAARPFLAEAAPLLGEEPPGEAAETQMLVALAARLREKLGAARPVARPGR